ncbi:MAG: dephospho-CoA kinase [Proteobacteria bacterium]|nr:dephospho-CoA kinase [Pseudomonadota bacterium]
MLIGLTGGIGSGKSVVAEMLKNLGAHIIDADQISRDVMVPESEAYKKVVNTFGKEILQDDRSIDRKKLGDLVFGDPEKIAKLNECTHPAIFAEIDRRVEEIRRNNPDAIIIIDAALLVETAAHERFDKLIVVSADEETQLKRLKERDGFAEEEAQKRISSQMPLKEKVKYADFVIHNDKGLEDTRRQVAEIYKKLSAFSY